MNDTERREAQPVLFSQVPAGSARQTRLAIFVLLAQSIAMASLVYFAPVQVTMFIRDHSQRVWVELPREDTVKLDRKTVVLANRKPVPLVRLKLEEPVIAPRVSVDGPTFKAPVLDRDIQKPVLAIETASSSAPLHKQEATVVAAKQVQTGGFGDENGPPPMPSRNGPSVSAAVGAFDAPAGAGLGNGAASTGRRAFVESTGFGGGVAEQASAGHVSRSAMKESGFEATTSAPTIKPATERSGEIAAVQVTYKPSPTYTDEARALRVEGDVLLEVVFEASGSVRVLRVVRGLGHGLDESARRAAEQIQFSPAKRAGVPTDFRAILHVAFRLA
jgi:TonB family protein